MSGPGVTEGEFLEAAVFWKSRREGSQVSPDSIFPGARRVGELTREAPETAAGKIAAEIRPRALDPKGIVAAVEPALARLETEASVIVALRTLQAPRLADHIRGTVEGEPFALPRYAEGVVPMVQAAIAELNEALDSFRSTVREMVSAVVAHNGVVARLAMRSGRLVKEVPEYPAHVGRFTPGTQCPQRSSSSCHTRFRPAPWKLSGALSMVA